MNAKVTHTFTVGSSVFFTGMPGFEPKDNDKVCLLDLPVFGDRIMNIRKNGEDLFFLHDCGKEGLIAQCLREDNPMGAGKFLVPEFAEHVGMTVDDLISLKSLFDRMDERHLYEQKIYTSYLENRSFTLTDEQREDAYEMYLKAKKI